MGLTLLKLINPEGWAGIAVSLALGVLLGLQALHTHHWHKQADHYEQLYNEQLVAFQKTVINYRNAAEQARASDAANAARVKVQQDAISKQKDASYEARIADARARADRLRQQLEQARTTPRGSSVAPVPGLSAAPGGPPQGAGEDGLSDALIATEQAIQLDELIKWVREQHAVNMGGTK